MRIEHTCSCGQSFAVEWRDEHRDCDRLAKLPQISVGKYNLDALETLEIDIPAYDAKITPEMYEKGGDIVSSGIINGDLSAEIAKKAYQAMRALEK